MHPEHRVADSSTRSFRLSPVTDIVTYLARKNLGGPAADVPSAAADAGTTSANQDRNNAVSIHFLFSISSAHLELQAIEVN